MKEHFDILIVGGGPAGLTAAIYARRSGHSVLLLEKEGFGGQIAASPQVENYPGFSAISGAALAERLYAQAEALGTRIELETVLQMQEGDPKTVVTDYNTYTCTALILATGMKHRTLGLPQEDTLSGISFCAVCDGSFYAGKDVAVCGGGNAALQDALFLADLCHRVIVIHRRAAFRGDPILVAQLQQRENVSFALSTVVTALESTQGALTGLALRQVDTGDETSLPVSGLFEAVGQLPERTLSASILPVDPAGFIPAGEDCRTTVPGVFVAGDCRAKTVRQLTTACADGAVSAIAATRYCQSN